MKKLVFFLMLFFLNFRMLEAQVYKYEMMDDSNKNYMVTIDMSEYKILVTFNGSVFFSSTFYRTRLSIDKDEVAFAFQKNADPSLEALDDVQYFLITLSTNLKAIQYNNLANKEHFVLYPKEEISYRSAFKSLVNMLDGAEEVRGVTAYQQEAKNGSHYAEYKMGQCYESGVGVAHNSSEAYKWYAKAAEGGYVHGMRKIALSYKDGVLGLQKNQTEARKWFLKAAECGNAESQYYYARLLYENNAKGKEMFEWFRRAANQGYEPSQTAVAQCYMNGWGTKVDGNKACEFLRKSADQGNVASMHELAIIYYNGQLVPKNNNKSLELLRGAVYKNYAPSQVQLGVFYLEGITVKKDENEAFRLFKKAAEQNEMIGQKYLGICYMKGLGTKKNKALAREWLQKAAKQGDSDARRILNKL